MAREAAKYLVLLACLALLGQAVVREEKSVVVDGVTELWRLVWKHAPMPACSPDDPGAFTCPCAGFAYGERGRLDLVRLRDGREIDRLALTPFFVEAADWDEAVVQRWECLESDDIRSDARKLAQRVRTRPLVTVMDFADYDHDGQSTEFFLLTGSPACGHQDGVVIGLSPDKRRLHAFGSALHPAKPLYLQPRQWDALRSSAGPVRVVDWACGDHGAETETEIELGATGSAIRVFRREYGCTEKGHRGKLLRRTQL